MSVQLDKNISIETIREKLERWENDLNCKYLRMSPRTTTYVEGRVDALRDLLGMELVEMNKSTETEVGE